MLFKANLFDVFISHTTAFHIQGGIVSDYLTSGERLLASILLFYHIIQNRRIRSKIIRFMQFFKFYVNQSIFLNTTTLRGKGGGI